MEETKGGDGSSQAFTKKDMIFFGMNGKHLYVSNSAIVKDDEVKCMETRYIFQKKNDNGYKIKYSASTNTKLCPVIAG
eukprot:2838576-Ditylum_brightwellii.AAC.1